MKTKGVMLSMLLCAVCTAWAGNDRDAEKIRLVEKIYREQGFMKYASPEFKRIVRKGEKIAYRDEPMGCELFEHYQLGFSNGDSEVPWVQKLKISVRPNGMVHAHYLVEGKRRVDNDFKISCNGGKCVVDDVLYGKSSYRKAYDYIVKFGKCPG